MVTRAEWYQRANAEWPDKVPPLTFEEAAKAAQKLYRYATGKTLGWRCVETTGNRNTWGYAGELRVNATSGWKTFVHCMSHWIFRLHNPTKKPHDKEHARLEARLIRQVVRRGWLAGKLRRKEPEPKPEPTPEQQRDAAIKHAERMLAKATTRAKRAETIRRKWERKLRAVVRAAAAKAAPAV